MRRLAAATISALSTVHAGFDREKDAGIDSFLNLTCEVNDVQYVSWKDWGI